jgi:hypothetical protein
LQANNNQSINHHQSSITNNAIHSSSTTTINQVCLVVKRSRSLQVPDARSVGLFKGIHAQDNIGKLRHGYLVPEEREVLAGYDGLVLQCHHQIKTLKVTSVQQETSSIKTITPSQPASPSHSLTHSLTHRGGRDGGSGQQCHSGENDHCPGRYMIAKVVVAASAAFAVRYYR